MIAGSDPGNNQIHTTLFLISKEHFDTLSAMSERNIPNLDGPGVPDPNLLNHKLVSIDKEGLRTVYVFQRIYFRKKKDGTTDSALGYLKSWKLVKLPTYVFELHWSEERKRTYLKRVKVDDEDRNHHPDPEYGSTFQSVKGWQRPVGEDEKPKAKSGKAADLEAMSNSAAKRYWTEWKGKFYPDEDKWKRLGLLPGQARYELERVLPKDTWRRKAGIPKDVKKRQDWMKESKLEVISSIDICQKFLLPNFSPFPIPECPTLGSRRPTV